jgi:hypothetical protein
MRISDAKKFYYVANKIQIIPFDVDYLNILFLCPLSLDDVAKTIVFNRAQQGHT